MARYTNIQRMEKGRSIRTVILGGGGVVFDQFEWEGLTDNGQIIRPRRRSHVDGQGISFLRAIGIHVALASSADAAVKALVERWNNLPSCKSGEWSEVSLVSPLSIGSWLARHASGFEQSAFMGAEFAHWKMLEPAGLRIAPCDAASEIRERCDLVVSRPGGNGAVRDFADWVLKARGVDPFTLATT